MAAKDKVTARLSFAVDGEAQVGCDMTWKGITLDVAVVIETKLIEALKELNELDSKRLGIAGAK